MCVLAPPLQQRMQELSVVTMQPEVPVTERHPRRLGREGEPPGRVLREDEIVRSSGAEACSKWIAWQRQEALGLAGQ